MKGRKRDIYERTQGSVACSVKGQGQQGGRSLAPHKLKRLVTANWAVTSTRTHAQPYTHSDTLITLQMTPVKVARVNQAVSNDLFYIFAYVPRQRMVCERSNGTHRCSTTPRAWGRGARDAMRWPTSWSTACWHAVREVMTTITITMTAITIQTER